ncbi:MAG: hypothetical protein CMI56_00195 [Parcubacteria group bacterium]|nr:hypothetical protein [Parcubacteria group bacterium]|tara:strand:- start:3069 stop:3641 length:573 start_codon:yes stop_codon:yes gene_type:complete
MADSNTAVEMDSHIVDFQTSEDLAGLVAFWKESGGNDTDFDCQCIRGILDMCFGNKARGVIRESGCIKFVLECLEKEQCRANFVSVCFQLLTRVLDGSAAVSTASDAGILRVLSKYLALHASDAEVQGNGAGLVWLLASDATVRGQINSSEIPNLVRAGSKIFKPIQAGRRNPFCYQLRVSRAALQRLSA